MNIKKIIIVYRKELLDILRDRRTIITSIVIPLVLYPLIIIGSSSLMSRQQTKIEEQISIIAYIDSVQNKESIKLGEILRNADKLQILENNDDYRFLIKEKIISSALVLTDSVSDGYHNYLANIYYDKTNDNSDISRKRISNAIYQFEKDIVQERLAAFNVQTSMLNVIEKKEHNLAHSEKMLGYFLAMFLPYLLIVVSISGGALAATDLIAGEKERGTLETLLVSSAKRVELIIGKYLTVLTVSIISFVLNLFSITISARHLISQTGSSEIMRLSLPFSSILIMFLIMLPLISFFSAILLSISAFSRNMKEAKSYESPLLIVSMMAAMITFFPGFKLNYGIALIPVVNVALLFKQIMIGDFSWSLFLVVIGSTIALDILAISYAVNLFKRENILFRTAPISRRKAGKKALSPQIAFLVFIAIILLLYYVGSSWQIKNLMNGLIKTEIFLILLPVILLLRIFKLDKKETLRLYKTKPLNYLLIIIMSISVYIIAGLIMELINLVYPIPVEYIEKFKELLSTSDKSVWTILLVVGVLPGICEEILFRGFLIRGFEEKGKWNAIVITGILFGILHLDPFRLIPIILIGIWLGFLLYKTNSLYIPIIAHISNNAISLIISFLENSKIIKVFVTEAGNPNILSIILAVGILAFFLPIFLRINKEHRLRNNDFVRLGMLKK